MNSMGETIHKLIARNGLIIAIYFILAAVIFITSISLYFRFQIVENSDTKERILEANSGLEFMNKYVNLADLGLRGYMLIPADGFLTPYTEAINSYQNNLDELRAVLSDLGYDVTKMDQAERAIQVYMNLVKDMVSTCKNGNVEGAIDILKSDPGYDAWKVYSEFERDAQVFIDQISETTNENYGSTTLWMVILQLTFLLLGVPILVWALVSHRRSQKHRAELYQHLSDSNKSFIFNPGTEDGESEDESGIVNHLVNNLKKVTEFVSNITNGNYDIEWAGLTNKNAGLNKDNIAGELITMRDQMKKVKSEDEKRIWISQGLSDFADIIRNNQDDFKSLSEELISKIVNYLDVQIGGLFIINHDNEDNVYLELTGCYAYNRLKTIEKKIAPGKGLVGQCYLEGETIYMTKVPQDFVNITSGLGDTRPGCVLIIPLKLNERIEGVIELASLKEFAPTRN